jgi:hypothetical protein
MKIYILMIQPYGSDHEYTVAVYQTLEEAKLALVQKRQVDREFAYRHDYRIAEAEFAQPWEDWKYVVQE